MITAHSVEQVRRAEAAAMAGLEDGELMQRAAAGLADVAAARLEQRDGTTVVALVGSGDNGGDALYAVADLADRGFPCAVVLLADKAHSEGLVAATKAGAVTLTADENDRVADLLAEADLVLEGVIGIGGTPGLRAPADEVRDAIPDSAYVIAVDLPSGHGPDGCEAGDGFWVDETVTFSIGKPVHLLPPGELACGLLTVVDIGVTCDEEPVVERLTHDDLAELWPVPGPFDDKYTRGVLGLVVGSEQFPGAATLAATAAVTSGAGMVRYVGPDAVTDAVRAACPEVVAGRGRVQAWVVGSGLDPEAGGGADGDQVAAAREVLAGDDPCVVDAGALALLDGPRDAPTLLTPHAGELARLAERLRLDAPGCDEPPADWSAEVRDRPVRVARAVADRLDAVVLLKGAVTLVVPPTAAGRAMRSQADAPSWLGTAGSGDVLAGLVGNLLAAGLDPVDAGSVAAGVHGLAGHRANPDGPVRALDVARAIGPTVAALLRER